MLTTGSVYTNAVSNRHIFMPLKPHRKLYGFKAFTRCQSQSFQVLSLRRSRSHSPLLRKGIWVRLLRRHFVFVNMAKHRAQFPWTDEEVQLLLKVTNEYKVSKMASAALRVRFAILNLCAQVKFRAKIVTVFKSMRFRRLHHR